MSNTVLLSVRIADLEAKAAALPRARESRVLLLEQLADYEEVIRQGEAAECRLASLRAAFEGDLPTRASDQPTQPPALSGPFLSNSGSIPAHSGDEQEIAREKSEAEPALGAEKPDSHSAPHSESNSENSGDAADEPELDAWQPAHARVLEWARGQTEPFTVHAVREALGLAASTAHNALQKLVRSGELLRVRESRALLPALYQVADMGRVMGDEAAKAPITEAGAKEENPRQDEESIAEVASDDLHKGIKVSAVSTPVDTPRPLTAIQAMMEGQRRAMGEAAARIRAVLGQQAEWTYGELMQAAEVKSAQIMNGALDVLRTSGELMEEAGTGKATSRTLYRRPTSGLPEPESRSMTVEAIRVSDALRGRSGETLAGIRRITGLTREAAEQALATLEVMGTLAFRMVGSLPVFSLRSAQEVAA